MEVRSAEPSDIPAIISLLKLSLGESLLPKSEEYWRWKHFDNPFGKSPVLIAFENGVLVGVRAFMRWSWVMGHSSFHAVRAVDTATHPEYQGRGIFRKLTLDILDSCNQSGVHFVFNTPNKQSRPGYLKMGWQNAGRLAIQLTPVTFLDAMKGSALRVSGELSLSTNTLPEDGPLGQLIRQDAVFRSNLHTFISPQYLRWRYIDVPVVKYNVLFYQSVDRQMLVFGRLKESRLGVEFRITDILSNQKCLGARMKCLIKMHALEAGANYITCSGAVRDRFSFGISIKYGPVTTVKPLAWDGSAVLMNFKEWSPSLGDLELF